MSVKFNKNGIVSVDKPNITNLYTGKQSNISYGKLTYDYETDVFKDYGFSTCIKLEPTETDSTGKLTYSYIMDSGVVYGENEEYIISLYAYVSEDCNADFRMHVEGTNRFTVRSNTSAPDTRHIVDTTKGKVIWIWAKCNMGTTGNIRIMFYPNNTRAANTFTTGYQLFAGITVYRGSELYRPMNNGISANMCEVIDTTSIGKNRLEFNNYIEL